MVRKNQIVTIRENAPAGPGFVRLVVDAPAIARQSRPGQFCMLTAPGVFLRRPFSVHDVAGGRISFLYKVIGAGTSGMAGLEPGDTVAILGPLGVPYDDAPVRAGAVPVIVAGGTGIASVHFLAQRLPRPGILLYGARTSRDLLCLDSFRALGWTLALATDDGSRGHKGVVTHLLDRHVTARGRTSAVYACGPGPMLDIVAAACRKRAVACQVSLEEMMACGVGNCQGCAVHIDGEYKMVCKDGPVFSVGHSVGIPDGVQGCSCGCV